MLLHELGQHVVFASQLFLQGPNLALQGGGGSFSAALKDQAAPLEKLLLPAIKLAGLDAVLVAQVGDGLFVHQVGFEDGDLLFGRQTAPLGLVLTVGHVFRSGLSANPNCGKVHFQLRQDRSSIPASYGATISAANSSPFSLNP